MGFLKMTMKELLDGIEAASRAEDRGELLQS
jgi:hypothetical protein